MKVNVSLKNLARLHDTQISCLISEEHRHLIVMNGLVRGGYGTRTRKTCDVFLYDAPIDVPQSGSVQFQLFPESRCELTKRRMWGWGTKRQDYCRSSISKGDEEQTITHIWHRNTKRSSQKGKNTDAELGPPPEGSCSSSSEWEMPPVFFMSTERLSVRRWRRGDKWVKLWMVTFLQQILTVLCTWVECLRCWSAVRVLHSFAVFFFFLVRC